MSRSAAARVIQRRHANLQRLASEHGMSASQALAATGWGGHIGHVLAEQEGERQRIVKNNELPMCARAARAPRSPAPRSRARPFPPASRRAHDIDDRNFGVNKLLADNVYGSDYFKAL